MRILFDQGTPVPLRESLAEHEVSTAYELDWSTMRNGDLLAAAEQRFDLLITTDQNLPFQQNLEGRHLAILVLPTANWPLLRGRVAEIVAAVNEATPGRLRQLP